jgi:hypothetical protein
MGSGGIIVPFLNSALMDVSGQLQALATLCLGKEPTGTHWIGGRMGPRAHLDAVELRKIFRPCRGCKQKIKVWNEYSLYKIW